MCASKIRFLLWGGKTPQTTTCSVSLISGCFKTNNVLWMYYFFFFLFLRLQADQHLAYKLHLLALLHKPWFIQTPHFWGSCWSSFSRSATLTENNRSHMDNGQRASWKKINTLLKYFKKVVSAQAKQEKMWFLAFENTLRFYCKFHFSI